MPRRNKIAILVVVLILLVLVLYRDGRPPEASPAVSSADEKLESIAVENPALRLDLMDRVKKFQYEGSRRNIFSAALPAPPPVQAGTLAAKPTMPAPPPAPSPLVVPAAFFGYVTDARTGTRRAFFNEGDDVYVLGVGEILLGRFRLLQIGNNTAELEETTSGRRTTLTMEQPGP
jgi:hypothetical protein